MWDHTNKTSHNYKIYVYVMFWPKGEGNWKQSPFLSIIYISPPLTRYHHHTSFSTNTRISEHDGFLSASVVNMGLEVIRLVVLPGRGHLVITLILPNLLQSPRAPWRTPAPLLAWLIPCAEECRTYLRHVPAHSRAWIIDVAKRRVAWLATTCAKWLSPNALFGQ